MLKIFKNELFLKYLLFSYTGGVAFFFGSAISDLYLIFICAFILTQYVSSYFYFFIISKRKVMFKIKNRYLNMILNIIVNFALVNMIILANRILIESKVFDFVLGPITFGLIYGAFYVLYFNRVIIRLGEFENEK